MCCSERLVIWITERQIAIQQIRIYAVQEAERCTEAHAEIHILRQRIFNFYILIGITQEDEVTHLQGNGQESTYAGKLQQSVYPIITGSGCSGNRNRFADEAVEERYTGNGERRYKEAHSNKRHLFCHTAELVNLADTGCIDNRTGTHKEQRFIQDVREGMGSSTVQCHRRANAYTSNHEADLADNMVTEQTAHIVFHNRIGCTIKRHEAAKAHQEICSGKDTD